ncbi:endonuclease/exonuclease/phosphatase [Enterovibrio calviensis]|uniref:endonuclease/exonuclease/phosphatase family protein n=1 Tax=Enterovibrio calviensis TaxID=91359 RepID=UPI003735E10C
MRLHYLKFGWWNVSLSPPKAKSKGNPQNYQSISTILIDILKTHDLSLMGVCEVSSTDMDQIQTYLQGTPYEVLPLDHPAGNTRFDAAVIFDPRRLSVSHIEDLKRTERGQMIKLGQVVQVFDKNEKDEFKLILCHWASRINTSGDAKRKLASEGLYDASRDMMCDDEHIIIMGDFNASPYDSVMIEGLKATRCHEAVRRHPTEMFYNPFWRALTSREAYNYTMKSTQHFPSGSHRYKNPFGEYWHTYDQIVFSGNFLGQSEWHLNESTTRTLFDDTLISSILDKKSIIDHLPVVCEIVKHP